MAALSSYKYSNAFDPKFSKLHPVGTHGPRHQLTIDLMNATPGKFDVMIEAANLAVLANERKEYASLPFFVRVSRLIPILSTVVNCERATGYVHPGNRSG